MTGPGLEPIVGLELNRLGIEGTIEPGGVSWRGPLESGMEANLHLRAASRIVARVARFQARSFIELERHLRRVEWAAVLGTQDRIRLRVTSRKSRLYHERAIAERFRRELSGALGTISIRSAPEREEELSPAEGAQGAEEGEGALLIVRFLRDRCLVSLDSSGALLHRRGYRQQLARAPLRESLAAALLLALGWEAEEALLDPLCGSGTIPIEAALIARQIPPGLAGRDRLPRTFAFEEWPDFEAPLWDRIVARARARIRPEAGVPILGSDRDPGAIEASRSNAQRAGVERDIDFEVRALSENGAPAEHGLLLTNPPYGVRVGKVKPLRDLYARLGALADSRFRHWTVALLSADRALEHQTGLDLHEVLRTRNGGIPVSLQRRASNL